MARSAGGGPEPEPGDLAALPLLAGATEAQVRAVAERMRAARAETGEVLGRQGEPGEEFWLILDGRVEITVQTGSVEHHIAEAGRGSIVGELAILRHLPRTATVTAVSPCRYLAGREDAMDRLLAVAPVRDHIRMLASRRLAEDLRPVPAVLADGTAVLLRPVLPSDRDGIDTALHNLSVESVRRRFFTTSAPSPALVDYLVDLDYVDHFAWMVLDAAAGEGVAVARYVRSPGGHDAEMAFTTIDRFQGHGAGTFLLGALGVAALEAGVGSLVAYTLEDNRAMRAVFAKADAEARYDEPGVLHLSVAPERAAALLDGPLRDQIATAVHDVVTAASLALT